ncbi:MAG: branched-chain amino acid ABC transporter substrate-binding protein [Thermoleophilia bacterium]
MSCTGAIGVMGPYGGLTANDATQMNWARVSLDKFNQEHKSNFTIEPANVDDNVAAGVRNVRRFVANPNVIGVVGPTTSVVTRAVGPILDAADLVYVSPSATNETLTDGRLKNFYRDVASDAKQAPAMGGFIAKHLKPQIVLIVTDDEVYSQDLSKGLKAKLDEFGVRSRSVEITLDQTDFADVVDQVDASTNVVALPLVDVAQATAISSELAKAGKYPELIGGDALFLASLHAPGAFVTTYASDLSVEPSAQESVRLYQTIFGSLEYFGAPSYVAMQIVLEAALEVCSADGEVSRAAMVEQLPKTHLDTSILGMPISFTSNHELKDAPIHVYQSASGGFTLVQ